MRTIESAREEFVKKLKTDLSQNLDFDFTRPEMCAAFVIKYFDKTRMFITKDKDLQLAIATPEGQNPNAQLTFRLTTENGKDIMELLHKHPNKTYITKHLMDEQYIVSGEGVKGTDRIEKFVFVLDYIMENGMRNILIHLMPTDTMPIFAYADLFYDYTKTFEIKSLKDYIWRLENKCDTTSIFDQLLK